ncbi:FAD-dependent oxidoreductase [soil metagenome]
MSHVIEPSREIPLIRDADVIVCGGGPAGIGAALAAARSGARTVLLEVNGCLGGVWTSGLLAWLFEMDQPGISREITRELDRRGARQNVCSHSSDKYAYDVEAMKLLLEEMLLQAGVEIHLHTRVVASLVKDKKIRAAITESKSGREAWTARCFIDATGDGDLAARAGCGFDLGKPQTGELQPFTFMGLVTARDIEALKPFIVFTDAFRHDSFLGPTRRFLREIQAAGPDPSYHASTLFHVRDNLLALMINHEYGVSPINERDVTRATIQGRAEVNRVVDALRQRGGIWEGLLLVATPEQIGTREARRIHGRYTVTAEDMRVGVRHEDGICLVSYWIDIHSTDSRKGKGFEEEPFKTKPYEIPLRALCSRDLDNLMMAGRCISGDFLSHSSYRVTGVAVALGQAAGVTSALAARENGKPSNVPATQVRQSLQSIFKN